MLPGKLGNEENEWSDTMNDEANEELPFVQPEASPEELALHIIDPMDDNPEAESQHTQQSDAIPHDFQDDEPNAASETSECAHPSCHCQVSDHDFCSTNCADSDNAEDGDAESCDCTHTGCEGDVELNGLHVTS